MGVTRRKKRGLPRPGDPGPFSGKVILTVEPGVPSTSNERPTTTDYARRSFGMRVSKTVLLRAVRCLQAEVVDRRREQQRINKFLYNQGVLWLSSDVYTIHRAMRLAKIRTGPATNTQETSTRPAATATTATATKPTVLGRLPKLMKTPAVIIAAEGERVPPADSDQDTPFSEIHGSSDSCDESSFQDDGGET